MDSCARSWAITIPGRKDSFDEDPLVDAGEDKVPLTSPMSLIVTGLPPVQDVAFTLNATAATDLGPILNLILIDRGPWARTGLGGLAALAQV